LARGRNQRRRRASARRQQKAAAVAARSPSHYLWIGVGAGALAAIAAAVLFTRDTERADLAATGAAHCSISNVRHMAVDRASAVREIAKPPAYTQGLIFADGQLYEGTGQEGLSTIVRLDTAGGPATELARLDDSLFGEGIAKAGDRFYQLTWQGGMAFAYAFDPENRKLDRVSTFHRDGEGWGLTASDDELILSDGSDTLSFLAPETFALIRTVPVRLGEEPMRSLNELEIVDGEVLANIYGDSRIVGIEPVTGCVRTVIDASRLLSDIDSELKGVQNPVCDRPCSSWDFVLNGIAYDHERSELYLTGKNWPKIFVYRYRLN
jgi:glutamine cyclotransferase